VAGGVVYFGSLGNHLYAVDTKSGQEKWRFRTEGGVFSSPLIADGVAYVGSWDWNVYAVDTATGRGDHFCGQR
jgi:outer membrane protein assembly factor BamB